MTAQTVASVEEDSILRAPTSTESLVGGWIDIGRLGQDTAIKVERDEAGTLITSDGFHIRLNSAAVDCHVTDRTVVLALGRPSLAGRRMRASELVSLVASDALASASIGGRFALVAIDMSRPVAYLRTDRFAVWPLCWAQDANRLAFSDRADAVLPAGQREIDLQALFDYVYFHVIPAPRTVFRGVARLEPGSELQFSPAGVSVRSLWRPKFSTSRQSDPQDLAARFRDTIRHAVETEATDSAVGCFLSGGTDSSTVAGMLKATTGSAETFSIGFDEQGYDEMEFARIAARHFGTKHHEHYVTPDQLVTSIPRVAAHYDQPFGNSSAVPAFICAQVAHDRGIRKLLAGDGGDELFGGNSRYAKQKVFEAWWGLPSGVRTGLSPVVANPVTRKLPLFRKAASYVDQASVPMPARLETYNLLTRFGASNVFAPAFLRRVEQGAPANLQAQIYARHADAPFIDRMLAYDWRFTLSDNDLPKVCGTTQLAGVEAAFPLLSDALVDLSTELAPSDKVRGLRLRHFFKQSLVGFLPPEIIAKKKHGFGLPVGRWLVSDRALRGLAGDSLSSLAGRGLILPRLVDDLMSRHLEEHAGYHGEMIWVLMMLEQWLAARAPRWSLT